ncbi:fam-m protein [Plasmodium malariae]|uniref:Fam-m protein n=1 Tax=Plasmodium malariae TaxID=5858 RepID=A0A1D3TDP4_PLAMA|nr:fam-m protein [Plasmodium malariae]SCP03060.1 fam-m protein [Plasmodium malariae]
MRHKINIIIFIKIAEFIILTWISNFSNYVCISGKSLDGNCKYDRKVGIKSYRLLEKYKHDKDSNNVCLKERFPNTEIDKQKDISYNEKVTKRKNKQSNKSLLNKSQYYTEYIDYNNGIFDGKHFHFEKKWIKKRNYDDFLDKKSKICDILLKKIKFRSYGLAAFIFFLFMLIGIGLPILCGLGYMNEKIEIKFSSESLHDIVKSIVDTLCPEKYSYLIMFSLIIFILSIIIIIAVPKILKNNEKYKKIKLMRE